MSFPIPVCLCVFRLPTPTGSSSTPVGCAGTQLHSDTLEIESGSSHKTGLRFRRQSQAQVVFTCASDQLTTNQRLPQPLLGFH